MPDAEKILLDNGYEGLTYLTNFSYDTALVGVTHDDRVVYDYDKMVEWIVETQGWTVSDAIDWIEVNVLPAIPFMGEHPPAIMYRLYDLDT